MPVCLPQQCLAPCEWAPTPWRSLFQGESRVVGQAADPPPWTLPEQGISRGWEPIHKGQALLG